MNLQLFLIEGKISNLKFGPDILDLLKAYNATVEASFEIEEFTRFACNIDEHVVEGTCSALCLRNNDVVKAVVEKREDGSVVYSVWAVLRPADGLLYMSGASGRGIWPELRNDLKWTAWWVTFSIAFFTIVLWILDAGAERFLVMLAANVGMGLMWIFMLFFAESGAEISTAIFTALGFPNPKSLDLSSSSIGYSLYRYRRVINAQDDPHGSPEPPPLEEAEKRLLSAEAARIEEIEKKREMKKRRQRKRRYEKKSRDRYPGAWP